MNRFHQAFAVLAGVVGIGIAMPASAIIMTATYTGTVSSTYNQYGTATPFGTNLSGLVGQAYTATYVYDTSLGNRYTYNDGAGSSYDYIYGGSYYGNTNPILSAFLTIGSTTYDFSSSAIGQQVVQVNGTNEFPDSIVYPQYNCGYPNCSFTYFQNYASIIGGAVSPASLETPFSWNSSQFGYNAGLVRGWSIDYGTNQVSIDWSISLSGASVDVTLGDSTSVPEPASLGLLGLGLAGIGFVRRRKAAVRT